VIKKQPPIRKIPLVQEQTPRPTQFNATPRFNFSSTPRPTPSQNAPASTPTAARYLTPAQPRKEEIDTIETSSDSLQDVRDSIEMGEHGGNIETRYQSDPSDEYGIEERTPKRQRRSSSLLLLDEEDPEPGLRRGAHLATQARPRNLSTFCSSE